MDYVESAHLHGAARSLACQAKVIAKCNSFRFEMIDAVNEDDHSAETINHTTIQIALYPAIRSRNRDDADSTVTWLISVNVMTSWQLGHEGKVLPRRRRVLWMSG